MSRAPYTINTLKPHNGLEGPMFIGSLAIVMSLLGMIGVFALLALDDKRRAQSEVSGTPTEAQESVNPLE